MSIAKEVRALERQIGEGESGETVAMLEALVLHENGPLVAYGVIRSDLSSAFLDRSLLYALATASGGVATSVASQLCLVGFLRGALFDRSAGINAISLLHRFDEFESSPIKSLISHTLVDFLGECLADPVLAEEALDFAATAPSSVWGNSPVALRVSLADRFSALLDGIEEEEELVAAWRDGLVSLREVEYQGFKWSPLRRCARELKGVLAIDSVGVSLAIQGVDDALLPRGVEVMQELRLDAKDLMLSSLNSISEYWCSLYRAAVEYVGGEGVSFQPEANREGSYILVLKVRFDASGGEVPDAAMALLQDRAFREEVFVKSMGVLAGAILESGAEVSIRQVVNDANEAQRGVFMSAGDLRDTVGELAVRGALTLDSVEVPQADDLQRVIRLVELVAGAEEVTPESLGVTRRQVSYYKQATRVLGLLGKGGVLTPAGFQLAKLRDEERLRSLVVHFESSSVGYGWILWSDGRTLLDVSPESALLFLEETASGLSETTLKRRSSTLRSWLVTLSNYHYAKES